jgi:1-acyl-sn-glycerol-3-phosphate acyltransferase
MEKILNSINRCWIYFCAIVIIAYFKIANGLKVYNVSGIPKEGGVLIASNHVSAFETFIIPASIIFKKRGKKIFAPAKSELFQNFIVKTFLTSWGSFPVKRNSAHIGAMRKIINLLEKEKVMVFPEGTRSKTGELGRGNRMLGRIVLMAKPIVVPVRVFGAEKILGNKNEKPKPFHKITVKYGNPINLKNFYAAKGDSKELSQKIIDHIMEAISAIH